METQIIEQCLRCGALAEYVFGEEENATPLCTGCARETGCIEEGER